MSKFDELIEKARNIQGAMTKAEKRKKKWQEEKISEVEDYISEVIDHINNKDFEFKFGTKKTQSNFNVSGIALNMEYDKKIIGSLKYSSNKNKTYFIKGGTLGFFPKYNGEIEIIYYEPEIHEHSDRTNRTSGKLINTIKVEEISKQMIQKYLGEFFERIIKWESQE